MINLGMSLFDLGYMQVLREKQAGAKIKNEMLEIINKAIYIRFCLDEKEELKEKIKETQFKKVNI